MHPLGHLDVRVHNGASWIWESKLYSQEREYMESHNEGSTRDDEAITHANPEV